MTVHFIIVNYNSGDWLGRAVSSIKQYCQCNITVVDNNSADNSLSEVRRCFAQDATIRFIENQNNLGFAAANNQVLSSLKEEFAILMNPDCEIKQATVTSLLAVMEKHSEIGLLGCLIENLDGSLQVTAKRRFPTPLLSLARLFGLHKVFSVVDFNFGHLVEKQDAVEYVEAISGAFMVVRKTAMQQVGLLDQNYFMHCEDLDWCKRFLNAGWRVACLNTVLVRHAKGVSSKTRPIGVLEDLHAGMNLFFDRYYAEQCSIAVRMLVKSGIHASLIVRSAKAWLFLKLGNSE